MTYVLDKGNNYHIIKVDEGYVLNFNNENKLLSQRVKDVPETVETIAFCDEKIPLVDGKYLIRVRDSLIISED